MKGINNMIGISPSEIKKINNKEGLDRIFWKQIVDDIYSAKQYPPF